MENILCPNPLCLMTMEEILAWVEDTRVGYEVLGSESNMHFNRKYLFSESCECDSDHAEGGRSRKWVSGLKYRSGFEVYKSIGNILLPNPAWVMLIVVEMEKFNNGHSYLGRICSIDCEKGVQFNKNTLYLNPICVMLNMDDVKDISNGESYDSRVGNVVL